jgi:hypothetical protein
MGRTYTNRMIGDGILVTRQMSSNLMVRKQILLEYDKTQTTDKKKLMLYKKTSLTGFQAHITQG